MARQRKANAQQTDFPDKGDDFWDNLPGRHRTAKAWQLVLQVSTIIGIIALTALLLNIINGAFGYVASQNSIDPDDLVADDQKEQSGFFIKKVPSEKDYTLGQ